MSGPQPTNNAPVGSAFNRFKLDPGTLALSQMRAPALQRDPWSHITLAGTGSLIRIQSEAFVQAHLSEIFGIDRKGLERYAAPFSGTFGRRLRPVVSDAAKACKIPSSLVAAVMVFEQESARFWKDENYALRGGLESLYESGNDSFISDRGNIKRAVPAARKVVIQREESRYCKERKKNIQDGFVSLDHLALATAATIKYKEIIARSLFRREGGNFDSLQEHERLYFTRLAYNPGGQLLKTIRDFLGGQDVFDRSGARDRRRPRRGATLCTAVALYLKTTVFS